MTRLSHPPDTNLFTVFLCGADWSSKAPGAMGGPQLTALHPIYNMGNMEMLHESKSRQLSIWIWFCSYIFCLMYTFFFIPFHSSFTTDNYDRLAILSEIPDTSVGFFLWLNKYLWVNYVKFVALDYINCQMIYLQCVRLWFSYSPSFHLHSLIELRWFRLSFHMPTSNQTHVAPNILNSLKNKTNISSNFLIFKSNKKRQNICNFKLEWKYNPFLGMTVYHMFVCLYIGML